MTGLPSWTVLEAHVYVLLSPWRLPPGLSVEYFIKVGSPQSAEMSVQIVYHKRKQWKKNNPQWLLKDITVDLMLRSRGGERGWSRWLKKQPMKQMIGNLYWPRHLNVGLDHVPSSWHTVSGVPSNTDPVSHLYLVVDPSKRPGSSSAVCSRIGGSWQSAVERYEF